MKRTLRAVIGALLIFTITFSTISICQNVGRHLRADLTEAKLYSLSDGTRAILARINQPITLQLYYAKTAAMKGPDQIKFFNTYYEYVRALLEQYAQVSNGQVRLEVIDPRPFSDEEQNALRAQLTAIPITEEENFFFGLVLQTPWGVQKTIEFFTPDRQNFVEYDITYLIDTAITREKDHVGVLSPLEVLGEDPTGYMAQLMRAQGRQPQPAWNIVTELRQKYEVSAVEPDVEAIPEDIDILLIIHPKDLPQQTLWAIDQFVLAGGRAIVCVDPFTLVDMPSPQQRMQGAMPEGSNLPDLLTAWGLELPANTLVGDRNLTMEAGLAPGQRPQPLPGYLQLNKQCFNPDAVITGSLNQVFVLFPGPLNETEPPANANLERTPLLHTTDQGNAFEVSPYQLAMLDPQSLALQFTEGSKPVPMAYLVRGAFASAFPDGVTITLEEETDPADESAAPKDPNTRTLTGLTVSESSDCAVVVFSDVDFITDSMAYQRAFIFGAAKRGDNSALLLNAIEVLTGSADLISVRSRGSFERPFTRIEDIEAQAEEETRQRVAELEAKLRGFEQELSQLQAPTDEEQQGLVRSTVLQKIRDLEIAKRQTQAQLREVNMHRRERIDEIENRLRAMNLALAPGAILLIAVLLACRRAIRRRFWVRHVQQNR